MRYMLFCMLSFLYLVSCSEIEMKNGFITSENVRSKNCLEYNKIRVIQVVKNGALSESCPDIKPSLNEYGSEFDYCYKGDIVFLEVPEKDNDFVDDQKFKLPSDKCFVANGRYAYTTVKDIKRVIRKIKIADAYVTNPDISKN